MEDFDFCWLLAGFCPFVVDVAETLPLAPPLARLTPFPFAGASFETKPARSFPSTPSTTSRYRVTCAKPTMSDRAARRDAAGSSGRSAGRGRASVGAAELPLVPPGGDRWRGERRTRPVISTCVTVCTFRASLASPSASAGSGSSTSFGSSTCIISSLFSVMIYLLLSLSRLDFLDHRLSLSEASVQTEA